EERGNRREGEPGDQGEVRSAEREPARGRQSREAGDERRGVKREFLRREEPVEVERTIREHRQHARERPRADREQHRYSGQGSVWLPCCVHLGDRNRTGFLFVEGE